MQYILYIRKDGLTLVTIHDAILTNLWIKEYEPSLKRVVSQKSDLVLDQNGVCPQCQKMVTYLKKKEFNAQLATIGNTNTVALF